MNRPNVLLITVHDLGDRLGCYGHASVGSPNLDRLASEGVRLANHFTTGVYCSPSRGSIMTGLHPHVNGLQGLAHRGWDLKPDVKTLPQMLKGTDYRSVLLGYQHETPRDNVTRLGYDEHVAAGLKLSEAVIPEALAFFDSRAKEMRPWFAALGVFEVHNRYDDYESDDPDRVEMPAYVPDCPEAREDMAAFDGAIRYMDARMGEVLDALDANGLSENTIVLFTTDHGPAWPRAKATVYDPGLRCALIVRHPAAANPGGVMDAMTSHVDITPSILELMGLPQPEPTEGVSFAPALRGEPFSNRQHIFAEDLATRAIRTERFKYVRRFRDNLPAMVPAWLRARPYAVNFAEEWSPLPTEELYDLERDPLERCNLIDAPEHTKTRDDLRGTLQQWLEDTNDRILKGVIPERTLT